jgi:hemerythrin superfamily protein
MSNTIKALIGFLILSAITMAITVSYVFDARSRANRMEKDVIFQYEENKNDYDNMWKTFRETAKVNAMYAADIEKVFKSVVEAREKNPDLLFKSVKEQNPNFDSSTYKRLMEIIEAGRADFKENQRKLLDKKRLYVTFLDEVPEGPIAHFFGFPKVDLNQYGIVTSDRTEGAFKSKRDDEIELR